IHPFLNGDTPSPIFHFNLAPSGFKPLHLIPGDPPKATFLETAELQEEAFHPPRTTLRILHPRLPLLPIDFVLPHDIPDAQAAPITVADVLIAIHKILHKHITHKEWATVSAEDQRKVTRAFIQRCRAEAFNARERAEIGEGVKRVDFLLGETIFQGLL
ncbi:hypothetical protein K438DRAFT_1486876, partial [Mycena galopus ATCC 62051]